MAGKIFISYRRDDSKGEALALRKTLVSKLPRTAEIFMDADGGIRAGDNFVRVLDERVAGADVVLALIGPRWVEARDSDGRRRLDNPDDFVRIELFAALKRDVPVLPVLLDDTRMPSEAELPDLLRLLASRQAVRVRHDRFDVDCDGIIEAVDRLLTKPRKPGVPLWRAAFAVTVAMALGASIGPWAAQKAGISSALPFLIDVTAVPETTHREALKQLDGAHQRKLLSEQDKVKREHARAEAALLERNAARAEREALREQWKLADVRQGEAWAKLKRDLETQIKAATERATKAEAEGKDRQSRLDATARELAERTKENAALLATAKTAEQAMLQARKDLEKTRRELWDRLIAAWAKVPPNPKAADECRTRPEHYEAIRLCTEAIAADANNLAAYGRRAFGLVQLGEYGLAIEDATRVIAADPKDASGWRKQSFWNRAVAYAWKEAWDQAIADYTERIKLEPHPTMYRWRAEAYQHRNSTGDHELAVADLQFVAENDKMPAKERDLARAKLRELGVRP